MNSDLEDFLDHVDQWKFKLHDRLKRMTPAQRRAFWHQIHEEARARGLHVVEPEEPVTVEEMNLLADEAQHIISKGEAHEL